MTDDPGQCPAAQFDSSEEYALLSAAYVLDEFTAEDIARFTGIVPERAISWLRVTDQNIIGRLLPVNGECGSATNTWFVRKNMVDELRRRLATLWDVTSATSPPSNLFLSTEEPDALLLAEAYAEDATHTFDLAESERLQRKASAWLELAQDDVHHAMASDVNLTPLLQRRVNELAVTLSRPLQFPEVEFWSVTEFADWFLSSDETSSGRPPIFYRDSFTESGDPRADRRATMLLPCRLSLPEPARHRLDVGLLNAIAQCNGQPTLRHLKRRLGAVAAEIGDHDVIDSLNYLWQSSSHGKLDFPVTRDHIAVALDAAVLAFSGSRAIRQWLSQLKEDQSAWDSLFAISYLQAFQDEIPEVQLFTILRRDISALVSPRWRYFCPPAIIEARRFALRWYSDILERDVDIRKMYGQSQQVSPPVRGGQTNLTLADLDSVKTFLGSKTPRGWMTIIT